uniref:Reverse transcriptase domain-containing protein n=1 Tax=Strongyloides venezuelensis TaxID=75913 RepID=A0A0K0FBD0_STRVS
MHVQIKEISIDNCKKSKTIKIKRGITQGSSSSPMNFILAISHFLENLVHAGDNKVSLQLNNSKCARESTTSNFPRFEKYKYLGIMKNTDETTLDETIETL